MNRICPTCGTENDPDATVCRACGSSLPLEPAAAAESRRIITVVFSDLEGSTALGEELDPESLRRVLARYFAEMRSVLERHGGTVEKYIGDAVMAVFGVPRVHEDDALRAVRSAVEMKEALERLNDELERRWGVRIRARTGVNTGEVVAGDPARGESFVVGDAVNVAARLEQAAGPGEILIGDITHRLVRDAVVADPVPPLALKGKAEPVPAWKVFDVLAGAPAWARRLDSPLIGRQQELAALEQAFERAVTGRRCELATVMGAAGVGKSRLTAEFRAGIQDRATVIEGRCLPYGEGLTFWPVVELLRRAAGLDDEDGRHRDEDGRDRAVDRISTLIPPAPDAPMIADHLAGILGLTDSTSGLQESFWAVRRLFEGLAAERALVAVFDDIHWGEPTFLDLIEYLADWIRGVPVLLLCLARPELLELRPGWTAARPNASVLTLNPLAEPEIEGLIRNLLGGAPLAGAAEARIAELAEGNPLFVEETLRMLIDDGLLERSDGEWRPAGNLSAVSIPPTIHALLAARLDRLDDEERAVIERAAVIGRVFWWGAVAELSPQNLRPRIGSHFQSLIRKELIRPDRSEIGGEDALGFAHVLIRDAAYGRIPKSVRAELHERMASWIERRFGASRADLEEIAGYHLEQAHRALSELGPGDGWAADLGRRAAGHLASAGRRALARGDMPAARSLLSRAVELLPQDGSERLELLPPLAFASMETGDFGRLQVVLAEMNEAAAKADPGLQAHALILGLWVRLFTDPVGWADEAGREARRAISMFKSIGDEGGLARAWAVLALVHWMLARFSEAEDAWEEASAHARAAGDHRDELENLAWVPLAVWAGPTPAEEAILRVEDIRERAGGDRKAVATTLFIRGALEAMLGRFDEARDLIAEARAVLEEVALTVWIAGPLTQIAGWVELLAGEPAEAERWLRWGYGELSRIGEVSWLSSTVAILSEALYQQGRHDEVEELTMASEQAAAPDDVYCQVLWRSVRAKVRAARGAHAEAEALARDAVAMSEGSEFPQIRAHALLSLSQVLRAAGRTDDARPAAEEAATLLEAKGNIVAATAARAASRGDARHAEHA